jgi:hypothetical protein
MGCLVYHNTGFLFFSFVDAAQSLTKGFPMVRAERPFGHLCGLG